MNLPSLKQLQYLVAVIELRHFGQAAKRCFVTQSTLSAGIQELENQLDAKLLERSKRKVMPTRKGLEVARQAEQLLSMAESLVRSARDDGTPLAGPLSLGVIPTIGPFLLPRVLPQIRETYPHLELRLVEDQTDRLLERIHAGNLDAAIIAFPYATGNLEHEMFWQENFRLAMPQRHPLSHAGTISTDALPRDELLLLEDGHCLTDHALAACKLEGLKSSASFQGTSLYTLLQMVAGGQGITFVPEMAMGTELLSSTEIALTPLADQGPHREIGLVWRNTYFRKEDLKLLAEKMKTLLGMK
jgi:LysR family hydrogen peroxide-inducible transcriptional activator